MKLKKAIKLKITGRQRHCNKFTSMVFIEQVSGVLTTGALFMVSNVEERSQTEFSI